MIGMRPFCICSCSRKEQYFLLVKFAFNSSIGVCVRSKGECQCPAVSGSDSARISGGSKRKITSLTTPAISLSSLNKCRLGDSGSFSTCLTASHIISHGFSVGGTDVGDRRCITALLQLSGKHRDSNGNQDGDDRDDDQQLGQGKALIVVLLQFKSSFLHVECR